MELSVCVREREREIQT